MDQEPIVPAILERPIGLILLAYSVGAAYLGLRSLSARLAGSHASFTDTDAILIALGTAVPALVISLRLIRGTRGGSLLPPRLLVVLGFVLGAGAVGLVAWAPALWPQALAAIGFSGIAIRTGRRKLLSDGPATHDAG